VPPLLRRAAPTGIASFNISADTLHSMFRIGVNKPFEVLAKPTLKALQDRFQGVEYLIVDEKSMVGLAMWGRIHNRLCEIRPERADRALPGPDRTDGGPGPFGGINVLIFGDYDQLPCIGDTSVCHAALPIKPGERDSVLKSAGRDAMRAFTSGATLLQQQRQRGNDPAQVAFRAAIAGVCAGSPTHEHIATLRSRQLDHLSPAERAPFADALHVFPTRAAVAAHNSRRLLERTDDGVFVPIVRMPARHTGPAATARAKNDDDGGLEAELCLAEHGTRAMCRRNLWTAMGLTNGTMVEIGS